MGGLRSGRLRGGRFTQLAVYAVGGLLGWRFAFGGLRLAVCVWRFAFGRLRLAVSALQFAVDDWRFALDIVVLQLEFCGSP